MFIGDNESHIRDEIFQDIMTDRQAESSRKSVEAL